MKRKSPSNLYLSSVKKILISYLLALFAFSCTKASASTILITNPQCPDNTYLSFGRPVDNDPAHFMETADFFLFKDGKAVNSIPGDLPYRIVG